MSSHPYDSPAPAHTPRVLPNVESRELPPYRGLVAVDAKDFTGHQAIEHGSISEAIPELLRASLERAELPDVWEGRRFPNSTGDGYVFGFEPAVLPFIIHPWLRVLQEVLVEYNVHSLGVRPIRLRVSLHVGPLPDSGRESDGNGTPRNDTHRLLDSRPVKAMLAASSQNVTQVAAILSDRCFQDAVVSGYTGRHMDHFIEVPATVEGKTFAQRAWLYVPTPSGNLYDRRVIGDQVVDDQERGRSSEDPAPEPSERGGRRSSVTTVSGDGSNLNLGTVHGGQSVHTVDGGGDYVAGNKAGTVHGTQGDNVRGDKNVGRS
ncbi:hypothetical protein [Streptomyces sp. NPDC005438]|uniref:hypothetical protein n=1 Tax=Streptomyces sp. NPDC005438 TaxID=3156880 RepID=UPI0033BA1536